MKLFNKQFRKVNSFEFYLIAAAWFLIVFTINGVFKQGFFQDLNSILGLLATSIITVLYLFEVANFKLFFWLIFLLVVFKVFSLAQHHYFDFYISMVNWPLSIFYTEFGFGKLIVKINPLYLLMFIPYTYFNRKTIEKGIKDIIQYVLYD